MQAQPIGKLFKVTIKNEQDIYHRLKRLRGETPTTPSEILVEASSTAILIGETVKMNPNLLTTQNHNEKTSSYLPMKFNCLKDKQGRFESHKDFLPRCIDEGLVPKGLGLVFETTIGSHG